MITAHKTDNGYALTADGVIVLLTPNEAHALYLLVADELARLRQEEQEPAARPLPPFEIIVRPLHGTPYSTHAIHVDGREIYSQLSPYSPAEIEARIRAALAAVPASPMPAPRMVYASKRPTDPAKHGATWRSKGKA